MLKEILKKNNYEVNMSLSQLGAPISLINFLRVSNLLFGVKISTYSFIKSSLIETWTLIFSISHKSPCVKAQKYLNKK